MLVVGTFAVVALVARTRRRRTPTSTRSAASARSGPLLAVALTVFLVAQAGVPFTSGFIAKFGVIQAAVDEHSYALAIVAMVTVGGRRLPVPADHGQHVDGRRAATTTSVEPVRVPFGTGLAIAAAVVFTLVVGFFPDWLLDAAEKTTQFAR